MRDGDWKLYGPRIPEAMTKSPDGTRAYRDNFRQAHQLTSVCNEPVYRELSPPGEPCLFHLPTDPGEENDLAPRYPHRCQRMQQMLANWFDDVMAAHHSLARTMAHKDGRETFAPGCAGNGKRKGTLVLSPECMCNRECLFPSSSCYNGAVLANGRTLELLDILTAAKPWIPK